MSNEWVKELVNRVVDQQNAETAEIKAKPEYQEPISQQRFKALIELREQTKPIFVEALTFALTANGSALPATSRMLKARMSGQRDQIVEKMSHLHLSVPQSKLEEQLALENSLREVVLARTYDTALSEAMAVEFGNRIANADIKPQR